LQFYAHACGCSQWLRALCMRRCYLVLTNTPSDVTAPAAHFCVPDANAVVFFVACA
jgi:hypothetical protein